jgi:hypothetical protein
MNQGKKNLLCACLAFRKSNVVGVTGIKQVESRFSRNEWVFNCKKDEMKFLKSRGQSPNSRKNGMLM